MSAYVYSFTDCINACASFNSWIGFGGNGTCYAVSWNLVSAADEWNCWLKDSQRVPFSQNETADSAVLLLS